MAEVTYFVALPFMLPMTACHLAKPLSAERERPVMRAETLSRRRSCRSSRVQP